MYLRDSQKLANISEEGAKNWLIYLRDSQKLANISKGGAKN
jgi:hypothetical protein